MTSSPPLYETITVEKLDTVARVWLSRPEARNAQNQQMLDELSAAFRALANDDEVRVVILAARGPHFSSGHDLREGSAKRADLDVEQRWAYEELRYFDYCIGIWDFPKPVIAQVQGACIAAGFMIANMCDLIVVSEDAYFSDPVVHTLAAAATEVLIHPWVMGMRKAKEMLYTGEPVSAAEALRIGMVNRMVATESLADETLVMARRIALAPPFAIKLIKRSLNRTLDVQGLRNALQAHFDTHQLSHMTSEYAAVKKAGLDGALKKRPVQPDPA